MIVLGIESTCDETGCAIVRNGQDILSNVVATQSDLHAKFGGVVPEIAGRRQIDACLPVLKSALDKAKISIAEIDLIAVANGPGLIGSILVGLNFAKGLAWSLKKPLIGINHVEAHLYASCMSGPEPKLPAIGVVISGGHTALYLINDLNFDFSNTVKQQEGCYKLIGQTQDDALGEAFDKVARLLGLPYPGGPELEKLASTGDPDRFSFTTGKVKTNPYDFSFSGLKTAFLYHLHGQNGKQTSPIIPQMDFPHLAASFQHAAFSDLLSKTFKAKEQWKCKSILFGGGVTGNSYLRALANKKAPCDIHWPAPGLSQDNGAMVAGLGFQRYRSANYETIFSLEAYTRCSHGSPVF